MTQRACDHHAVFEEVPRLRLLSLARSLPRNFVCFRHGAYCGLTRGGPLAAEKPSPHRNPQLRLPRKNPLTHQSKFASCSNNAASAPQGFAFSPSAICCASTRCWSLHHFIYKRLWSFVLLMDLQACMFPRAANDLHVRRRWATYHALKAPLLRDNPRKTSGMSHACAVPNTVQR